MLASTAAGAAALAAAAGAASGPTPSPVLPPKGLAVAVSDSAAGARPVTVTLAFPSALVCGRPTVAVSVLFPVGERMPDSMPADSVRVGAGVSAGVAVHGRTVVVQPPTQHGMMCHSITLGTEIVTFTRTAGLGNPTRRGSHEVVVARRTERLGGTFSVS